MTDNDIIQLLKNHIEAEDCVSCESFGKCDEFLLTEKVLDLITRQQAEIERLKGHLEQLKHRYDICKQNAQTAKSEAIKEFAERVKARVIEDFLEYKTDAKISYIDNLVKEMVGRKNEN